MKKRNIWFLAVISAIAVSALILVQLVWIQNAIDVQKKQFDQLISKSLGQVINKLEAYETLNQLRKEMESTPDSSLALDLPNPLTIEGSGYYYDPPENEQDFYYFQDKSSINIDTKIDLISGDTVVFVRKNTLYNNNPSAGPSASITRRSDLEANYLQLLSNKKVYMERVFDRMVLNPPAIKDRVNHHQIDSLLSTEFAQNDMDLSYRFAVRTGTNEYLIKTEGFDPDTEFKTYAMNLFPRDVVPLPNFIVVYFPDSKSYFFKPVGIMAGSSLALALLILIISFIAIFVIFRQKKLSEIKNDFINNMTHELKTPIATISLASQWLSDGSIDHSLKNLDRISGIIREESQRLGGQVEKVLQMSILDEGLMSMKPEAILFDKLVEKAIEKVSLQIAHRNVQLIRSLEAPGVTIDLDVTHMTNVIFNLLDNAIKYSDQDPTIEIRTRVKKELLLLSVHDHGIGISKEHLKRIFDKFFRIPTGNLHDVKGFGLGLSYVQKITELHNGTITVTSELGKGSVFTIQLPILQTAKADE